MLPTTHRRLLAYYRDDPADPDRPLLSNPDVQKLAAEIAPGSEAHDLGGVMSLNLRLAPADLVLRVHQPFVSSRRLLAVQAVRLRLADQGLLLPVPLPWHGSTVFRCGPRWAELEPFIPHRRAPPDLASYRWLFASLGELHRALARLETPVPRPLVATYAPPGTLQRWLPATLAAVQHDPDARNVAQLLGRLIRLLRRQWIPAGRLPVQLVHGDARLSNLCLAADARTLYLDFGFLARRPRVHDLAYSLAFMCLALGGVDVLHDAEQQLVPQMIEAYERTSRFRLTPLERKALFPYAAAVPLYHAALDGFSADPAAQLPTRLPFLRIAEYLLAHPGLMK